MKKIALISVIIFALFRTMGNNFETHIIIIGGGKTPQEAATAKEKYRNTVELTKQIDTEVKIILSDTIKGLNKGFYIAIMGFCTDEYKAKVLTLFAGKYIKGVYYKKVVVEKLIKSPTFTPEISPFEGSEYNFNIKHFKYIYNDINNTNLIYNKSKATTVIVSNAKPAYSQKEGLIDVKYYLAWLPDTKQVVYINMFQFTKLYSKDWESECNVDEKLENYGGFEAIHKIEECEYNNGVKEYSDNGYEWSSTRITFPLSAFSFDEVFNYFVGLGYFSFVFEGKATENNKNEENECTQIFTPDKELKINCPHSDAGIEIEGNTIIFYSSAGA